MRTRGRSAHGRGGQGRRRGCRCGVRVCGGHDHGTPHDQAAAVQGLQGQTGRPLGALWAHSADAAQAHLRACPQQACLLWYCLRRTCDSSWSANMLGEASIRNIMCSLPSSSSCGGRARASRSGCHDGGWCHVCHAGGAAGRREGQRQQRRQQLRLSAAECSARAEPVRARMRGAAACAVRNSSTHGAAGSQLHAGAALRQLLPRMICRARAPPCRRQRAQRPGSGRSTPQGPRHSRRPPRTWQPQGRPAGRARAAQRAGVRAGARAQHARQGTARACCHGHAGSVWGRRQQL